MRKNEIRIGLLGCGGIVGAHAQAFSKLTGKGRVVAVAEPNKDRCPQIRKWFGDGIKIVPDYHEVLSMGDVDAVDIVLPHDLHMPAVIASAEAGKDILVEKVMARNIWECDRMIEACEKAGVTLTICHDRRYHGEWVALKEIVDSGMLGEIFLWKLDHNQNVQLPPGHWIRTRDGIGGGAIMSCLTHQIDGLRWYGGEVDSVTCMTKTIPERMEGEFMGMILAKMKSGALAELSINWWTRSNTGGNSLWYEMVQVCGTKGEAYRMNGKGTFIKIHDSNNKAAMEKYGEEVLRDFVKVPYSDTPGHLGCIDEWLKSLRHEKADIRTSGRECRGTVEVAEAAYLSEQQGRTISLPIAPKPWAASSGSEIANSNFPAGTDAVNIKDEMNPDNPLSKGAK